MFSKIAAVIGSSLAIVMAIIAYYTKDMPLAAFAFTILVATELHEANSSLSDLNDAVDGLRKEVAKLRKRLAPKVGSDRALDGPDAPTDHV